MLDAIGLGGPENAGRRLIVLRAIDKLDRLGPAGVRALLGSGRKDESGDFTRGAELSSAQADNLMLFFGFSAKVISGPLIEYVSYPFEQPDRQSNASTVRWLRDRVELRQIGTEGADELEEMAKLFDAAGYSDRIRIDPSVVRGLEYYTGPVFEAELTFEVKDDDGRPVRFGSVGGGGRYDELVARFREEPVPATGFSIGVSRLLAALRAIKSPIVAAAETPGPVVVLALDRDADSMANYQRLVANLRQAGIAAELYLGSAGMNAQLKYADRRRSRVAVIQGSNERNAAGGPQVTIRDLNLGAELAKTTKDRADYLELRQRAQASWPQEELVERVREVLARR